MQVHDTHPPSMISNVFASDTGDAVERAEPPRKGGGVEAHLFDRELCCHCCGRRVRERCAPCSAER